MQTYAPTRAATPRRRLLADLGLAVVIGLAGALAKKHLDFHLGIPGHAGVGWIAVSVAALLDLPGLRSLTGAHLFGAATAGVLVHVAKFVFVLINVWLSGTVRRVEQYGLSSALVNHVAFGAAGGLAGWGPWRAGRAVVARFPIGRVWPRSW